MDYDDLEFEWDIEKEKLNIKKHGINFNIAKKVFNDLNRIEIFDADHSTSEEQRYRTIGIVKDMIFVVYVDRHDKIRIISARLATKQERGYYYDSNFYTTFE